jgi:purine-binding chemotaxis protein CheW
MPETAELKSVDLAETAEYCTFHVGDLLLGIEIHQIEEINRHLDFTPVPHAPLCVRGVVNLRGEVVTVVDLRVVLGLSKTEVSAGTRNVIVNSCGEQIGLLVDRIGDVISVRGTEIDRRPANLTGTDAKFIRGVYPTGDQLVALLDVEAALACDAKRS